MLRHALSISHRFRPSEFFRKTGREIILLTGIILAFILLLTPETVFGNNVSGICGDCHMSGKNGNGAAHNVPLAQSISASVHKKFRCIECHEYHPEVKVTKGREAHAPFKSVECASCHVAMGRFVEQDPHYAAWKSGKLKSSPCILCHGYHNIHISTDPESKLNAANIKKFCSTCHKGIDPPAKYHREDRLSRRVCISCHNDMHQDLEGYHIDMNVFSNAIHHVQECIDCHSDITEIPHAAKLKEVDCVKCHESYRYQKNGHLFTEEYKESVHGIEKIIKGNKRAPWCSDCHGTHNILPATDPDSSISRKNVVSTCGKCHKYNGANGPKEDKTSVEQYNSEAHKKIFKKNPDLAKAVCIDCHGEHNIPARKEVPIIYSEVDKAEPVPFNHILHEEKITPCSVCHHRQLKPCGDCHTEKGDAKGGSITSYQAYHWPDVSHSCVGCHDKEKEKEGCVICHGLMSRGAMESSCYICHTGESGYENGARIQSDLSSLLPKGLPDVIDLKVLKKELGRVKFPHMHVIEKMNESVLNENSLAKTFHAGRPVVCITCHHHSPIGDEPPPCSTCHKDKADPRNPDKPSLADALHKNCFSCHMNLVKSEYSDKEKKLLSAGEAKMIMEPTSFTSDSSVKIHVLCAKCHEKNDWSFTGLESCAECHEDIFNNTAQTIHMDNCIDCHTPHNWNLKEKFVCVSCHKKDVAEKITVKEHLSEKNCQGCHRIHNWVDVRRFSVCEDCHRKKKGSKVSVLHKVKAHGRCGTCHDQHSTEVAAPERCRNCHRNIPVTCAADSKKTCIDSSCHDFRKY